MFTGLIRAVGRVAAAEARGEALRLEIDLAGLEAGPGDSVAVDGCCLTVASWAGGLAAFDLSPETISRTTLAAARPERLVNLEPALAFGEPLGGHLVLGHVDGVGRLLALSVQDGGGATLEVAPPPGLDRFLPPKASVAIDGISLTVANRRQDAIKVAIIPETLARTALSDRQQGDSVNVEVDPLARYAQGTWD